jgi:hypothetical protein
VVAPACIPTSSVQGFLFPHILANTLMMIKQKLLTKGFALTKGFVFAR